jgi:hypothetical protein
VPLLLRSPAAAVAVGAASARGAARAPRARRRAARRAPRPTANHYSQDSGTIMYNKVSGRGAALLMMIIEVY